MKFFSLVTHSGIRGSILIASFASSVLIARILGLESLAQYNLILLTFNLISSILIGPAGSYIHRNFIRFIESKKVLLVISIFTSYLIFISIIIVTCFILFETALSNYLSNEKKYLEIIIISNILFSGLFFTLLPTLNILNRILAFAIISISYAALSLLVPYLMLFLISKTWLVWLLGLAMTQSMLLLTTLLYLKKCGFFENLKTFRSHFTINFYKQFEYKSLFGFCVPLVVANFLGFSLYNGFRYFLVEDIGAFEYGKFVAAYTIAAGSFGIVEQVIGAVYHPKIYRGLSSSSIVLGVVIWNKSVETLVVYLIAMSGLLLLVGVELNLVVYGENLDDMFFYLKLSIVFEFLRVIVGSILFYFQISKAMSKLYYYYLVALPTAVFLIFFLPVPSLLVSWLLSISLGCCVGGVVIIFLIAREKAFIKINYLRITQAIIVSSACVYVLDDVAKKMLGFQSNEISLVISTVSFLGVFVTSDLVNLKIFESKVENSQCN